MTLDAYTLTWDQVQTAAVDGEAVVSWDGYLLCSRDRKFDERQAREHYVFSVAKAIAAGRDVPLAVRQEYEATIIARGIKPDHAKRAAYDPPPGKEQNVTQLVNAKGKKFSWSYTALTAFENCPAAYAAERFFCTTVFQETEAIKDGNRGHATGEDMLNEKPPRDPVYVEQLTPYVNVMLAAKRGGAELLVEHEITLTEDMKPTGWFAEDAWFRGKLDAVVIKDGKASIFDWKMGKVKNDPDQLRIFAASLSLVRPDLEIFVPKFIFPKAKQVVGCDEIVKEQIPGIWEGVLGRVERMQAAWRSGNFPARASGLCPWCSVYNECKYARRK